MGSRFGLFAQTSRRRGLQSHSAAGECLSSLPFPCLQNPTFHHKPIMTAVICALQTRVAELICNLQPNAAPPSPLSLPCSGRSSRSLRKFTYLLEWSGEARPSSADAQISRMIYCLLLRNLQVPPASHSFTCNCAVKYQKCPFRPCFAYKIYMCPGRA